MEGNGFAHWFVSMERQHRYMFVLIVMAVILAIFLVSASTVPFCGDSACFIDYANICGSARFQNRIATATVLYETNRCLLNKTIIALDPTESEIVRDSLLGKSMVCAFVRNDFSPLYLTRLSANLDNCEGELKEEIIRYQYFVTTSE